MLAQSLQKRSESPITDFPQGDRKMNPQEQPTKDNQGGVLPSWDVILNTWLTTDEAAKVTGLTRRVVALSCARGRLRAVKVLKKPDNPFSGEWRIDPESAESYEKRPWGPGQKKDEESKNDQETGES